MKKTALMSSAVILGLAVNSANAGLMTVFDTGVYSGWDNITQGSSEDKTGSFNYVGPGVGGQAFDAEYILYNLDGSMLQVAVQTGFDILSDSYTHTDGRDYYAGDLALSFDGDSSTYEFAIDFGFQTYGYYGTDLDDNTEGLYSVTSWSDEVYSGHSEATPFAMKEGTLQDAVAFSLLGSGSESVDGEMSYYRAYEFDLSALGLIDGAQLDAHWTMSCGNDEVNGQVDIPPVPLPGAV